MNRELQLNMSRSGKAEPISNISGTTTRDAMRVASLFSGIGGIELGLARHGHRAELFCELDEGARAVLATQFPDIPRVADVRELEDVGADVDLLAGGFPCQDLSQAGKTRGIRGAKSGLIGEVYRLLERRTVPWLLLENVPFMLQLARGEALEVVISMFEHFGYRWAYRVVDSRAFGLPQRRRRVLMLASLDGDPRDVLLADEEGEPSPPDRATWHNDACGFYWTEGVRGLGWARNATPTIKAGSTIGIPSPPAIVLPDGNIIKPDIRDAERLQGFPEDWTAPTVSVARQSHRWRLVGNAVSVDVADWVGHRLRNPGTYTRADLDTPVDRSKRTSWPTAGWGENGQRRYAAVSEWPIRRAIDPLVDFLQYPGDPLSLRATKGFRERTKRAKLRFRPGFLEVVDAHLARMNTT